jgi:hypothetical protein
MGTHRSGTALLARLEALQRGVDLIRRTRDREERRAMLLSLLRDLCVFEQLQPELLTLQEATLLGDLREAAEELRGGVSKAKSARAAPATPARTRGRTNGTPNGRATSAIRTASGLHGRESEDRQAPASGLSALQRKDPSGDRAPDSRRGVRRGVEPLGADRTADHEAGQTVSAPASHDAEGRSLLALRRPLTAAEWRQLGFYHHAAKYLAERRTTAAELKRMTRSDFLGIQGVGLLSLRVCERLLGRPLPPLHPDARFQGWLSRGIPARAARALSRAGISTIPELRTKSLEDMEVLPGLGPKVIAQLEKLQGRPFQARSQYWLDLGLPSSLSKRLVRFGILTVADFTSLTRESFLAIEGLGEPSLRLCEEATGRTLRSRLTYWLDRGISTKLGRKLVSHGIETLRDLRERGPLGLRGSGFSVAEIEVLEPFFSSR